MFTNIIFDMDGTLIDSAGDVVASLKKAYSLVKEPVKIRNKKAIIGPPLKEMILALTPDITQGKLDLIIKHFRTIYDNSTYPKTRKINNVDKLLRELQIKNTKMFVATSKAKVPTERILNKLKLDKYFEEIITVDFYDNHKLGKSDMVEILIKNNHLKKEMTLLAGDTLPDILAAKQNNIASAAFLNGYGDKEALINAKPDYCIKNMIELIHLFN